jgi:lipoprotein-releasing system permease protein
MRFEFFIAVRHLLSRRKKPFLALVLFISITGVILGVATLIIVISVMNGFEVDLRDKILGNRAHIVITHIERLGIKNPGTVINEIDDIDRVVAASPYVVTEGIISSKYDSIGIIVRGIDPEYSSEVINLEENIARGGIDFDVMIGEELEEREEGEPTQGIILGTVLAEYLNVDVDDNITLMLPTQEWSPSSPVPAIAKNYKVVGIFRSGMFEYDSQLAYLKMEELQKVIGLRGVVNGIEVRVDDIFKADEVSKEIKERLGYPYYVQWWKETNKSIFYALSLEKVVMFIILILIVLVAGMNISNSLIMTVIEKTREIGVLRALGADKFSVARLFILEGSLIGIAGTIIGLLLGIGVSLLIRDYIGIALPGDVYYIEKLPVVISWTDLIIITVASILISVLSTLYPALRASQLDPVEAIRYE